MEVAESSLIKALIVDDEVLARRRIREILKKDPEIQLVGDWIESEAMVAARNSAGPCTGPSSQGRAYDVLTLVDEARGT